MIVGNKLDNHKNREVICKDASQYALGKCIFHTECSAYNNEGVDAVKKWMFGKCKEKLLTEWSDELESRFGKGEVILMEDKSVGNCCW